MNYRIGDIVAVIWEDIANREAWMSTAEAKEEEGELIEDVGFLVAETESHVCVALSRSREENAERPWGSVDIIPRACVRSIRGIYASCGIRETSSQGICPKTCCFGTGADCQHPERKRGT